tara:strand:+ start:1216 stop:2106 length:891 start_codon:yes stop_codon:yes gene_type:complete
MSSDEEESAVKVVVNPYNFNNKLITEDDVKKILQAYDINDNINNLDVYQKAFIHKSYRKKNPLDIGEDVEIADKPEGALELFDYDNETLEFLGDSVLGVIVAKYLFERFPEENEGFLTKMRSKLVRGEMLGSLAKMLNFGEFIIISRHIEDKCDGRNSVDILEDSFEAFLGAMFLDFNETDNYNLMENFYCGIGYQICEKFIIHFIEDKVDFADLIRKNTNYKEQLMKFFKEKYGELPRYGQISVEGSQNERVYTMCVYDPEGNILEKGVGQSKKKAEQKAAKNILVKEGIVDDDS